MIDPTSKHPAPPAYAVVAVAVFFAGTGVVAGYSGLLLAREGNGVLAILLGTFLLASALAGFAFAGATIALHVKRRREQRRAGQL
jgi:hypothetical protein